MHSHPPPSAAKWGFSPPTHSPIPTAAANSGISTHMKEVNVANFRTSTYIEPPPATSLRMSINMGEVNVADLGMPTYMELPPATDFGMPINMEEVNAA